jgi:hypothetical protein
MTALAPISRASCASIYPRSDEQASIPVRPMLGASSSCCALPQTGSRSSRRRSTSSGLMRLGILGASGEEARQLRTNSQCPPSPAINSFFRYLEYRVPSSTNRAGSMRSR